MVSKHRYERDVEHLRDALGEAIAIIKGLADQQAEIDDWYYQDLMRLEALHEVSSNYTKGN